MEDAQALKQTIAKARQQRQKKGRGKKWLLALVLLLLLGLAVFLVLKKPWRSEENPVLVGNFENGSLDLGDKTLPQRLQELAEEERVTIQINTKPIFEEGIGDVLIQNTEHNPFDMRVLIYLGRDDTGEQVLDTGLIPPGAYLAEAPLERSLTKGEHTAIAYVSFWEGEDCVTTSSVDMTLVVR